MQLGLHMSFKENEFFSNETLSCTLEFEEGGVKDIIGTKIQWYEGKDVTFKETETKIVP